VIAVIASATLAERTLRDAPAPERRPSQRELVALSLLRCPDRG
jgi:hypothetical protein